MTDGYDVCPVVAQPVAGAPTIASAADLHPLPGLSIRQSMKRPCYLCCCQPNMEFILQGYARDYAESETLPTLMYVREDAPWCGRCMSHQNPGARPTVWRTYSGLMPEGGAGEDREEDLLFTHSKPWTCPTDVCIAAGDGGELRVPCCCNLPYLETKDRDDRLLGISKYICDACLFVPKYGVYSPPNGTMPPKEIYRVRPDTCCLGMCVSCTCSGNKGRCCALPFKVRDPKTMQPIGDAELVELWSGLKKECCMRNNYTLKYPDVPVPDPATKATFIGLSLLVDMTFFEVQK